MEILRSIQPGLQWYEGLPLGSGSVGAMISGGIATERILFNHEKLYLPFDNDFDLGSDPEFYRSFKDEMFEGRYAKAENMLMDRFPVNRIAAYQPLCELILTTHIPGEKRHYQRQLDLSRAEATVSWEVEGTHFFRRQFVSRDDNQFVLDIGSDRKAKMASTLTLDARLAEDSQAQQFIRDNFSVTREAAEDSLTFQGTYRKGGGRFGAMLKLQTDGTVTVLENKSLRCQDYTRLTLWLTVYAYSEPTEPNPISYDRLLEAHLEKYQPLYNRVRLDYPYQSEKSTDELLLSASWDTPDPALYGLMFRYSRYLFIACAMDCDMPPNLQGIWNGDYAPAWFSDFHNDENIQICMWQGLPLGMPEAVKTYIDYYFGCLEDYRQNARLYYNAQGIAAPISQTVSGKGLSRGMWNFLPGMAGWIGQLFFEHWRYTEDRETLLTQTIPWLEETALFYETYCTERNGEYHFIPSFSPENVPRLKYPTNDPDRQPSILCVDATFDLAVAREVLRNLIAAYREVGKDPSHYEAMLVKMPPYRINDRGALAEWLPEELEDNDEHRHLSHLYPFFPGREITQARDKTLFDGVKSAAQNRLTLGLTAQTGWSLTHLATAFARLGMGELSLDCMRILMRTVVMPNLMTRHNDHRPQGNTLYWNVDLQIDGVLGFANVIAEMFLCADEDRLRIAPGVPKLFDNVTISGLRAPGGLTLDIRMERGIPHVTITAQAETKVCLEWNGKVQQLLLNKGINIIEEEWK